MEHSDRQNRGIKDMKRLALFSFYSQSGAVRSFIYYYLERLAGLSDVVFIVNGSLQPASKADLEKKGFRVFCRENTGFDFGAWKEFLVSEDHAFFSQYDELILCNCSCYGPVYPFEEIFSQMDGRECDFWGLYRHHGLKDSKHHIPPHLQSYFLVIRNKLFHNKCFREYFSKLNYADTWNDAVNQETSFTRYFENNGFVSSSFLGSVFSEYIENPTIFMPAKLLALKFPLVKRKCFTTDYRYINKISSAAQINDVLSFIRNNTDYPVDLIYEDLLWSAENSHLIKALGLSYVLDSGDESGPAASGEERGKIAAVLLSSRADRVADSIRYLSSLPDGASVFVMVTSEELKNAWSSQLSLLSQYKVEIRLVGNGMPVTAGCLLHCSDALRSFDFVCLLNDLGDAQSDPPVKDRFFAEHCLSALLFSKEYVRNIIGLFRKNYRLGLLMPFVPMFAEWPDRILNEEWGGCRETALRIYSRLNLTVPFDEHPVAPWGGMFWLRGRAMEALYRHGWTGADSEPAVEKEKGESTLSDALLRMSPMIAQESGFFSGCVCPSELAGCQLSNMYFSLEKYSNVKLSHDGVHFSDVKKILRLYLRRKLLGIK